ncbi:hypothetical protein ACT3TY_15385 [Halomonas sp. AOP22-C1-8]|uniref:hypothetical protein n=1 Tax=Halomonas sp. AOP22-C1-8 TaxID=3457717 RepID=UPI0040335C8D
MRINKIIYAGKIYNNWEADELLDSGIPASVLLAALSTELSKKIDTAAGNARAAFVSPGSYIDQEYLLAKQEATAWLENGKDANAVPPSVEDHMAMFDVDAATAAQSIVTTAEQWEQALGAIRSTRLGGKAAVSRAETIEAAEEAAQHAIEQLSQYRPEQ